MNKQPTLLDFLDFLKALDAEQEVAQTDEEFTADEIEAINDALNAAAAGEPWVDPTKDVPADNNDEEPEGMTLLEEVIYNFLLNIEPGKLPTNEEARTIQILDEINSKYNL